MKEKILILGAAGFSGKHFVDYFLRKKLDSSYTPLGLDIQTDPGLGIPYVQIDLRCKQDLQKVLLQEKPEYLVNLAGVFGDREFTELIEVNVVLPQTILEIILLHRLNLKKILLIGSAAEYGIPESLPVKEDMPLKPQSLYGLSKVMQTEAASFYNRVHGIPLNIARTFNVIGKGMPASLVPATFLSQIAQPGNNVVKTGNLNMSRDFLEISDVIEAYWKILVSGNPGRIYNVCSGSSIKVKEILNLINKIFNNKYRIEERDELRRENDIIDIYGDNSEIRNDLGWSPIIGFESAIKNAI